MYMTDEDYKSNPFQITRNESLWDKISHARLVSLIESADLVESVRDSNSYGEFRFITLIKEDSSLTVFGHGIHEYREETIVGYWRIGDFQRTKYSWHGSNSRDHSKVLAEVESERIEYMAIEKQDHPSEAALLYSMIADLTDDDGAISDMEDFGY